MFKIDRQKSENLARLKMKKQHADKKKARKGGNRGTDYWDEDFEILSIRFDRTKELYKSEYLRHTHGQQGNPQASGEAASSHGTATYKKTSLQSYGWPCCLYLCHSRHLPRLTSFCFSRWRGSVVFCTGGSYICACTNKTIWAAKNAGLSDTGTMGRAPANTEENFYLNLPRAMWGCVKTWQNRGDFIFMGRKILWEVMGVLLQSFEGYGKLGHLGPPKNKHIALRSVPFDYSWALDE
jgi:hypothetical protein